MVDVARGWEKRREKRQSPEWRLRGREVRRGKQEDVSDDAGVGVVGYVGWQRGRHDLVTDEVVASAQASPNQLLP